MQHGALACIAGMPMGCWGLQRLEKASEGAARPAAEPQVVLPTGTVSISRRPVVSVAPDESPPLESPPVKPSAPGRHWLDEPEDLGAPFPFPGADRWMH